MVSGPLLVIATIVAPTYDSPPADRLRGEVVSRMMAREAETAGYLPRLYCEPGAIC